MKVSYETLTSNTITDDLVAHTSKIVRRPDILDDLHTAIAFVDKVLSAIHDETTKKGSHLGGAQVRTDGVGFPYFPLASTTSLMALL